MGVTAAARAAASEVRVELALPSDGDPARVPGLALLALLESRRIVGQAHLRPAAHGGVADVRGEGGGTGIRVQLAPPHHRLPIRIPLADPESRGIVGQPRILPFLHGGADDSRNPRRRLAAGVFLALPRHRLPAGSHAGMGGRLGQPSLDPPCHGVPIGPLPFRRLRQSKGIPFRTMSLVSLLACPSTSCPYLPRIPNFWGGCGQP